MKLTGYHLRDGFWVKECEFMNGREVHARETLIRNLDGQLIAVVKGRYEAPPTTRNGNDLSVAHAGSSGH